MGPVDESGDGRGTPYRSQLASQPYAVDQDRSTMDPAGQISGRTEKAQSRGPRSAVYQVATRSAWPLGLTQPPVPGLQGQAA